MERGKRIRKLRRKMAKMLQLKTMKTASGTGDLSRVSSSNGFKQNNLPRRFFTLDVQSWSGNPICSESEQYWFVQKVSLL